MDLVVAALANDGDVTVGIVDGDAAAGRQGGVEVRRHLVLFAEKFAEGVGVEVEVLGEGDVVGVEAVDACSSGSEREEQEDGSGANAASDVGDAFGAGHLVEGPLGDQDDTGSDEQHGPPVTVPVPEAGGRDAAEADEEHDDSGGEDDDRAEDGGAAQGAGLVAIEIALGPDGGALSAGLSLDLIAHHTGLLAGIGLCAGRRIGREACHLQASVADLRFGDGGRRRCGWRIPAFDVRRRGRTNRSHGSVGGDTLKDHHEAEDDDEEGPAVGPGDQVEAVQQEQEADGDEPDGAAQAADGAVVIGRGSVIGEGLTGGGHAAEEVPDA